MARISPVKGVLFGVFLVVAGFAGWKTYDHRRVHAIGDACQPDDTCADSAPFPSSVTPGKMYHHEGTCLRDSKVNYCSWACQTSADCPKDWRCTGEGAAGIAIVSECAKPAR